MDTGMTNQSKQAALSEYPGKELEAMSFAANYHRWIVDEFKPYLGKTAVEVGAGRGDLSQLLLQSGVMQLFAYEPSAKLFAVLQEKLHEEPRAVLFNDFFNLESKPNDIDSVIYINVLEHIENDRSELIDVHQSLNAGGHLLIFVPALSWLFSKADKEMGHFRRYSFDGLVTLVRESGFEIEKIRYFDIAGVIPWYINFVLLKNSFDSNSVALYDRLVVPVMRLAERILKPPVGKNILLVARKC